MCNRNPQRFFYALLDVGKAARKQSVFASLLGKEDCLCGMEIGIFHSSGTLRTDFRVWNPDHITSPSFVLSGGT